VLGFLSPGLDVYQSSADGIGGVGDQLERAGVAAAITAAIAVAVGALVARLGSRVPVLGSSSTRGNRPVAIGLVVLAVAGAAGFVAAVGDPIDWAGERLDELRSLDTPDLSEEGSRFTVDVGSGRYEYWEIALDEAAADPLLGTGGGGFQYSYLREREDEGRTPRDAHSVELETLTEYGIPGLALLLAGLGGAAVGVIRTRRKAPDPAAVRLAAIALAAGTYWLVHASVDWFWPYPAVTAPVLALLGAACAPAAARAVGPAGRAARAGVVAVVAVLALTAIPPFLSERYVNDAYAGWRDDLDRAYADLDRAADLNRLSDAPLLAEGAIAREAGDRERAITAFRAAAEKRPEEWAAHYLLAELLARSDPQAARAEIRIALELNPQGVDALELAEDLGIGDGA
jgi:tetratricopeptide (TPR) repeat protein